MLPRDKIIFIVNNNKYIIVYNARRSRKTIRKFRNASNAFSELPHVSAECGDHQDHLFWKRVYDSKSFNILDITTLINSKNYSTANQSKKWDDYRAIKAVIFKSINVNKGFFGYKLFENNSLWLSDPVEILSVW